MVESNEVSSIQSNRRCVYSSQIFPQWAAFRVFARIARGKEENIRS